MWMLWLGLSLSAQGAEPAGLPAAYPIVSECSTDLNGDGKTERAILSRSGGPGSHRLALLVIGAKSVIVLVDQAGSGGALSCTDGLSLTLGDVTLAWAWDGTAFVEKKAPRSGPEMVDCPKHVTCDEYGLDDCKCDAKGALHTAEGVCAIRFEPPCPGGKSCDANLFQDSDCVDEMNEGMDGGMDY